MYNKCTVNIFVSRLRAYVRNPIKCTRQVNLEPARGNKVRQVILTTKYIDVAFVNKTTRDF